MTPHDHELELLDEALRSLEAGFRSLPESAPAWDVAAARSAILEAAERMRHNYPYHHPLYVGQMQKPPHPAVRIAYALALHLNPNNHSLDGGRASSAMEKETMAGVAAMFGWREHLGHLTGGGTMANLEALWVARESQPGRSIVASAQAHYTHPRLSAVLGVPFQAIPADARGRMNVGALERALDAGGVGTVVVTLGTTAAGTVDPLDRVLELRSRYAFRVHVEAAYGGYFMLARNLGAEARRAYDRVGEADSMVVDSHKHGLQPYGCGCVLFRDPAVGRLYRHDSPYTYFSSDELHLGEISLECSRAGAAAVALWTTMRLLPLERVGAFAAGLEAGREAALALHDALTRDARFAPLFLPELDIVTWAVRAKSASEASARARAIFEVAAERGLHVAVATFPRAMVEGAGAVETWDSGEIACLRACVMKPDHREWMGEILGRLNAAASAALGG